MTTYCIHHNLSATCRECADPLDVSHPVIRRLEAMGFRVESAEVVTTPRDPAAVSGWWAAIPILAAAIVLGIVIGRWTA